MTHRWMGIFSVVLMLGVILPAGAREREAIFAGGCFWCLEPPFEALLGVSDVSSGYSGGELKNPTYQQVSQGDTGHWEVVKIIYEDKLITYEELLEVFWRNIDPTDRYGQFADRGEHYKTAIFYGNAQEKKWAELSKDKLEKSDKFKDPIVTALLPRSPFYLAENYHQDYYLKNPDRYYRYAENSGRKGFLAQAWKNEEWAMYEKPSIEELKEKLTPLAYKVTQKDATEQAYKNEFWDNHAEGIYVDVVSGEPLFSSRDKFDSGTGWPSFSRPIESDFIKNKSDRSFFMTRIEVRSRYADSHLGHLFEDGLPEQGGLRYCINSAALRFVEKKDMEAQGYGEYLKGL